jgi:lipopolysaccharide transport system ATP-binding protein
MTHEIAVRVQNLSKCFHIYNTPRDRIKQLIIPRMGLLAGKSPKIYYREYWALTNVSLEVQKGARVGIIGRNGSGKSTLLQIICGTLDHTEGNVSTKGRIAALLELGSGFNPEFTGRENVFMNGAVLGLSSHEISSRLDSILSFADIGDFIDQPIKTYSSGMVVRLAFAVAINATPDILVVDEALAVGDAAFQRKCMRRIKELTDAGVTLLFVSHDLETVRQVCSEALYMMGGSAVEFGAAKQVCTSYERDLYGASQGSKVSSLPNFHDTAHETAEIVDPDLLGASEKTYGDGRAQIIEIEISNQLGQRTNILTPNASYVFSYRVRFLDTVRQPVFGMMITNREGICVFGTNTTYQSISNKSFASGSGLRIEFHVNNHLGPGIYYLTCGIHTPDQGDGLIYIHRRMDVLIFKVNNSSGMLVGGHVNLNPRIEVYE